MNKKVIGGIVIVLVVALGVFFLTRSKDNDQTDVKNTTAQGEAKTEAKMSGQDKSFKELMSSGKPQKCEVKYNSEGTLSQGMVYIANQKMRADFTATVNGQSMQTHMIADGTYVHNWTDGQSAGFKMKMTAGSGAPQTANDNKTMDWDQKVNYDCNNWSVDNSEFTLPSNITFTDYTDIMLQGQEMEGSSQTSGSGSANIKAMQCQACDQTPESSRAQCKAALGC